MLRHFPSFLDLKRRSDGKGGVYGSLPADNAVNCVGISAESCRKKELRQARGLLAVGKMLNATEGNLHATVANVVFSTFTGNNLPS